MRVIGRRAYYNYKNDLVANQVWAPKTNTTNRAYPENANVKTFLPSTLKFNLFCGLHEI